MKQAESTCSIVQRHIATLVVPHRGHISPHLWSHITTLVVPHRSPTSPHLWSHIAVLYHHTCGPTSPHLWSHIAVPHHHTCGPTSRSHITTLVVPHHHTCGPTSPHLRYIDERRLEMDLWETGSLAFPKRRPWCTCCVVVFLVPL